MHNPIRLRPWTTSIWHLNLSEYCDLEQTAQEILTGLSQQPLGEDCITLHKLHKDHICPLLTQYAEQEFGMDLKEYDHSFHGFGLSILHGQGMEPHQHPRSLLTSVFYPVDSEAALVISDPRVAASRGLPNVLREQHFGNQRFQPVAGDLLIFPSYLTHWVVVADQELRLSFVNDLVVDEK